VQPASVAVGRYHAVDLARMVQLRRDDPGGERPPRPVRRLPPPLSPQWQLPPPPSSLPPSYSQAMGGDRAAPTVSLVATAPPSSLLEEPPAAAAAATADMRADLAEKEETLAFFAAEGIDTDTLEAEIAGLRLEIAEQESKAEEAERLRRSAEEAQLAVAAAAAAAMESMEAQDRRRQQQQQQQQQQQEAQQELGCRGEVDEEAWRKLHAIDRCRRIERLRQRLVELGGDGAEGGVQLTDFVVQRRVGLGANAVA
jgi:hypothetical protein